jgi:hypothetical protein
VEDLGVPGLRASDSERESVVLALREAVVEGRLSLEEFTDRVGDAQTARTHGELAALTSDLPADAARGLPAPRVAHQRALFSRIVRGGPWEVPDHSSFSAICGTVELDLRQARLRGPEVELRLFNLFGTITVIVPVGIRVEVEGGGLLASQVMDMPAVAPLAGSPVLRIHLSGPGGTLHVRAR